MIVQKGDKYPNCPTYSHTCKFIICSKPYSIFKEKPLHPDVLMANLNY